MGLAMCAKLSRDVSPAKDHVSIIIWRMIGLTDPQLKIIMTMASGVPIERRGIFLERCGAMLRNSGSQARRQSQAPLAS